MKAAELKFLKIVQENAYFEAHKKVLIALSGGQDSMTLFNWLLDLRGKLKIEIGIAHVNHGLRKESENEEKELRELAKRKEIPIYVDKFTDEFTEQKARDFRYRFFSKTMMEYGYTALVTGHHKGDVVETFLMREITGRPLRSLQGISDCQPFSNGELIRPLLQFDKSELDAPVHFEDFTNYGTDYFRNRIRNRLIPELTMENPQFTPAVFSLTKEIQLAMSVITDEILKLNIVERKINLNLFRKQSEALQFFILQAYFAKFPEIKIKKSRLDELLHIIRRQQQYYSTFDKNWFFVKNTQEFYLEKRNLTNDSTSSKSNLTILSKDPKDKRFMRVDLPVLGELEIRQRRPHDEILINGHHKKLRKYFIENHVPLKKRENFLIFVDQKLYAIVDLVCSDLSIAAKNDKIKRTLWVKPAVREEH